MTDECTHNNERILKLYTVSFSRKVMTFAHIRDTIMNTKFAKYGAFAVMVLLLLYPQKMSSVPTVQVQFFLWAMFICMYLGTYLFIFKCIDILSRKVGNFRVYVPLLSFFNIIIASGLIRVVEGHAFEVSVSVMPSDISSVFTLFFITQVLDTMFFHTFDCDQGMLKSKVADKEHIEKLTDASSNVINNSKPRTAEQKIKLEGTLSRLRGVSSGGTFIAIHDILHMKSQEHFVEITTADKIHFIRARLADLIDQTADDDGMQIHRSYWISANAIKYVKHIKHNDIKVVTSDGQEWQVAQTRKRSFFEWLDQFTAIKVAKFKATSKPAEFSKLEKYSY